MSGISFYALGGLDENGKNSYVLETKEHIFIVNMGAKVPISTHYGVDTITPNVDYLKKNAKKIAGIFITDTKNDSFSALPWFLMQIPNVTIYTSPFNNSTILERLSKYKLNTKVNVKSLIKEEKFGNVVLKPFQVYGAIPGTLGFNFETEQGSFVFMHNFVVGKSELFGETNLPLIRKSISKNVLALVFDSGRSNYKGFANEKIHTPEHIKEIIKKTDPNERIIIGAYDEEMTTLMELIELAYELKRPIVIYGKTFDNQLKLLNNKYFVNKKPFLGELKLSDHRRLNKLNNAIVFVTATVEVLYQRFIRITDNLDAYLKINEKDNVIMLAPPINGIETTAALTLDKIAHITKKITVVDESQRYQHRPATDDLREVVKAIKPKYFIPVQGLYRHQISALNKIKDLGYNQNNSLVLANGRIAYFEKTNLLNKTKKIVQVGDQIVDGFGLGDVSNEVISEREKLARNGVVTISVLVDKERHLVGDIDINYVGLGASSKKDELDEEVRKIFVQNYYENLDSSYEELQKVLRNRVRKRIFKKIEKEPTVIVSLYKV
ncbi:ribonuclease J [Mycoplasmopsis agassizii]|uniref:Ribonuclease J n=1 Tax=Mycoplasmopsis agassizii TaxID=33922 RepID=A0A269TI49_9BACT|nr:ribonuclease J [Mycoplasmopsis agassizii]PAK21067.1 ribonuclease J [Mycoplasmopsis agassizii]